MDKSKHTPVPADILKSHGLKITPARIAILQSLTGGCLLQSAQDIASNIPSSINKTTIYRTLDNLSDKGVLYKTHFRDGKTYYELQSNHHHHIVCTQCGLKESVDMCVQSITHNLAQSSASFSVITDHVLEFFGICTPCSNKS